MQRILFPVFIIIFFTTTIFAQVSLKIGGGGGVVLPASDYSGSTVDFYNGVKYGLSTGYNLHVRAKASLLSFAFKGEIDYSRFSNDGNATSTGQGRIEVSQGILSLRVGPEFRIDIPLVPLTPYIGANIAMNTIGGEVTFLGVSEVPSGTYDIESVTRFGLGFGGGVEFSLGPFMVLDIGIHYNFVNLFGKDYETKTNPRRLDAYLSVNDDKDPLYGADDENIVPDSRSISNIQITATLLFGI
jgi:opacity protein-like surface antigen